MSTSTNVPTGSTVDDRQDVGGGRCLSAAVRRWQADWDAWRVTDAAVAAVPRWRSRHRCLAGLATVEEVLAGCGGDLSVPLELADARLATVVAEAVAGDAAAARVALHRVMPGLVRAAARHARAWRRPFPAVLDDLAAAAWLVIVRYPVRRRPVKVAANIVLDAQYELFGYVPRTLAATVPAAPDTLPTSPAGLSGAPVDAADSAAVEVLRVLAGAVRAGLPAADGRLLAELIVFGWTPEKIAARDGLSSRTVRDRRRAAMGRLIQQVAAMVSAGDEVAVGA
jgi:DNA-directed RNA polymerase specialized sigma24 family protein